MLKRHLIFAITSLLAFQPLQAQEWLDRYMRERKTREETEAAQHRSREQQQSQRSNSQRPPRAEPVATPALQTPPAAPASSLRDVIDAEATPTPPASENRREVRRALPLEPFITSGSEEENREEPAAPAATPAIPRALPVEMPELRTAEEDTSEESSESSAPASEESSSEETADNNAAEQAAEEAARTEKATRDQATLDALDPASNSIRLTPGAPAAPADVTQFMLANSYYSRKEYDRAGPEYERYLNLYPRGADRQAALFRLAECYRQRGSFNSARQYYEALIYNFQTGDYIGPAAYRLAELYYEEKDFTAAVSLFRKASVWVKNPSIALSAKFYASRALQAGGRASEAIRGFEDVLTFEETMVNPFREAAKLALVELYSETGRTSSALKLLIELKADTQKESVRNEAAVRLGLLYLERKEPKNAQKELLAALLTLPENDPWRKPAEIGLLRIYYADGKYQEALALYEKSDKKFEASVIPEVLLILANSHRQLKQMEQATELYDRIITENPDSPYAMEAGYEKLVVLYNSNSRDLLDAINAYLEKYPDKGAKRDQLVLMQAELYYKTNQFAQAAQLYQSLIDSALPDFLKSEALFKLGWCEAQIGGYQNAIAAFTSFLKAHPQHKLAATALAQRAVCHERLKDYRSALSDLDILLRNHPQAPEREFALQRKGLILGQQDDNRGMVEAFRQLLQEFPKSSAAGQANYWIGQAAFQSKDYRAAIEPLRKAREQDEEFADRCSASLLASLFYLEERDGLTEEVDRILATKESKVRVQPQIFRWLGVAYLKDPAGSAKAEAYLSMLTSQEENGETQADDWLNLSEAQVKQKKWAEAEQTLGLYLAKVTDPIPQARGYLLLGDVQLGSGKLQDAFTTAAKVQQLQPEGRLNAQGRMLAGTSLAKQQKWEEAAKTYMGISLLFDDASITPRALEQAYHAYLKLDDEEQAKKTLNTLQSRYPEYKLAQQP